MPLYQYECEKCGERYDVRQKFVDAPLTVHEDCGGPVHRLLSAPALQFKGSGFYITDYAKNSSSSSGNGGAKKGDAPASTGEKSESSTKEAAPAATESKPSTAKPSSSSDTK